MAVGFSNTNKPINPRGADASPKGYNRASLFSGKALDFDGVNDHITFGTISDLTFGTGDFSAVLDWQIDSVSTYSWAIAKNPVSDFGIGINNTGGLLRLWIGGTLSLGTENILGSDWKKIAVVRESGVVSAYINGVAISLTETAMAGSIDSGELFVGSWVSSADFWNGLLNNIRIFNTALTAAQVADLYNNPEKVVPTGVDNTALKLWLPMMEGAGTTAYDGSGNGNHGTISGATYTHAIGAPVSQTAVIDWNKSYYFDGVDDSFTTGTYQALGDRTITLSFYSSDFSLTDDYPNTLFAFNTASGGNTDIVRISADGYVAVYDGATRLGTPTIQANENELTHIAIVTDAGSETKVYVNGELSYSYNAWSPSVGASDIFNIGQETDGASISDLWRGFIFNIGVFGSVLTQSEIQAIQGKRYADLTSAQKTNLVSFYSLQNDLNDLHGSKNLTSTGSPNALLIPQGLTSGRDLLGNLFENVRKQGALNLDGNSWAEVHDNASLDITDAITLEAWVYWDAGVDEGFISKWNLAQSKASYLLYKASATRFMIYVSSNGSTITNQQNVTSISNGWNHLVGVYDGANLKCYLNGALDGSKAYSSGIYSTDEIVEIGRYGEATSTQYNGPIAQPRIYNRALTAEEVARNFNSGKAIYTNS